MRRFSFLNAIPFIATLLWSTQGLAGPIVSDDFASEPDPNVWVFVNPWGDGSYSADSGQLNITVPEGLTHDLWTTGIDAPRLVQEVADQDFDIEVKFDSVVSDGYQMQGVVVEEDADTFVRVEYFYDGSRMRAYAAVIHNGSVSTHANIKLGENPSAPLFLRLSRSGDSWSHSYSLNGTDWQVAATFDFPMTMSRIGLHSGNYSGNGNAPAHTAVVDYFTNLQPAGPQDYSVTTSTSGQGSVTLSPAGGSYAEGTVVQLTAVPAADWEFDAWSGAATGTLNPTSVVVTGDLSVQAAFVESAPPEYSLSVSTVGQGSVTLSPAGGTYAEGTVVQLTAVPAVDWAFESWSGAATGSTSPTSVVVTGDLSVQAAFVESAPPEYNLTVSTVGQGSVTLSPAGGTYAEGTVVQLSAVPAEDWEFEAWSGAATGGSASTSVVVTGDLSVQAAFVEAAPPEYSLSVSTIGQGSVALSPAGGTYPEGTVVQLTAVPAADWEFEMWSGAATGSANPTSVVVTGDLSLSAEFVYSPSSGGIVSDEFSTFLDPNIWTFVNPFGDGNYSVDSGALSIDVPAGISHDLWTSGIEAPHIIQSVADQDFEVEVKLNSSMGQRYQMQGLVAQEDSDTFVRAEYFFDGSRVRAYAAVIDDGSVTTHANINLGSGVPAPMYLRLARANDLWTYDYSLDGVNWTTAASFNQALTLSAIGLHTGNFSSGGTAPAHTAVFDYFRNIGGPVGPSYTLTTATYGQGNILKSPDQSAYGAGTDVVLTAEPAAGWLFDSWSGDIAGTGNPTSVNIQNDMLVQALFVEDPTPHYDVDIVESGAGNVELNPPGGSYPEGTLLELTAQPAAGWSFGSWSGAVSGTSNPVSLLVDADITVTANFIDDGGPPPGEYELDVTISGSGNVELSPPGGSYEAGTVVQLLAVADPNWTFYGWSGDISGTQNPETVVISGDLAVNADFAPQSGGFQLSNVAIVDTGPTSARVTWTTNEAATSEVQYGIDDPLSAEASNLAFTQSHALDMDWLRCEQAYTVRVASDAQSGSSASVVVPFTTGACWNPGLGNPPDIDVWDDDVVLFGDRGEAQRWVNIRGRVSTAHELDALSYSLNGGAYQPLSVGPDFRRLSTKGDFNVELLYEDLLPGANQVEVRAEDTEGRSSMATTSIEYVLGGPLSLPFAADWSHGADVEEFAYAVDGNWIASNGEVSSESVDYDRLLVLGDMGWTDYEFTVPVTVDELGPHAYHPYSNAPMVGLAVRWSGHTPWGSEQPSGYWFPTGGFAWYRWGSNQYELRGNENNPRRQYSVPLEFGVTYMFKVQVVTQSGGSSRYRFKVWDASNAEPGSWQMEIEYSGGPASGAIGLLAHHASARFGPVVVSNPTSP